MNTPICAYRKYYPMPTIIDTVYEYQNINKDPHLRNNVTIFFLKKIKKWTNKKIDYDTVYSFIRRFVNKTSVNWYDLREQQYPIIKKYLLYKISKI